MKWLNVVLPVSILIGLAFALRWYIGLKNIHYRQHRNAANDFEALIYHDAAVVRMEQARAVRQQAELRIAKLKEQGHASLAIWADRINRL